MAHGAHGDLAVAPMPMPLLPDQQQEQQPPEQSSMEPMWQSWSWATMMPSAQMLVAPQMQQLDAQQDPREPDAEPVAQRMDEMNGGRSKKQGARSTMRQRRGQQVSDVGLGDSCVGTCAADAEPDARCGKAEQENARSLADEFLERLRRSHDDDHTGESRAQSLEHFKRMAFAGKVQCRAAQLILEEVPVKECVALAGSLRGRVRASMGSMFANYVLQKVIELTPASASSFVAEELCGVGAETARHRYGCRVLCRLLEFGAPDEPATHRLFEEVLADIEELLRHSFGGYVAQHLLEFGSEEQKRRVGQAVSRDLIANAAHLRGSRIVEAALQHCAEEDRRAMEEELLASSEEVLSLAVSQAGCHVVKALLRTSEGNRRRINQMLRPVEGQLRNTRYGKHVLAAAKAASA